MSAVAENLVSAMRFFGHVRKNGEVCELPGVCLVSCGLNYAAFNAALLSEHLGSDANQLRHRIEAPAAHFHSRSLRWTYWVCDDYLDDNLRRESRGIFRSFGLSPLTDPPGMFAERLTAPRRKLPELEIRPVQDAETRRMFAYITAIAFEIPQDVSRDVYGSARGWGGDFHGYVGYVNGAPIATTATVTAAGVIGVYSVGTLPLWRHKGYAESLMRRALEIEQQASGVEATVLQSTQSGVSLYERMGYRRVTRFSVYIS